VGEGSEKCQKCHALFEWTPKSLLGEREKEKKAIMIAFTFAACKALKANATEIREVIIFFSSSIITSTVF